MNHLLAFIAWVLLTLGTLLSVPILTQPPIGSPLSFTKALPLACVKCSAPKSPLVRSGRSLRQTIQSAISFTNCCKFSCSVSVYMICTFPWYIVLFRILNRSVSFCLFCPVTRNRICRVVNKLAEFKICYPHEK